MSEGPKLFTLKKTGALAIGVGLFVFLLYLYLWVPFGDFVNIMKQADPFYYSLAFLALLLSVGFYSLAWQLLLRLLSVKSSFWKAFQFVWVGNFVDLLVPAESISGDIARVYLMSKDSGDNAGKVVASVIGHRILTMIITLGGLVIGTVYFAIRYRPPMLVMEFVSVIAAGTIVSMILIFYLSRQRQVTSKIVEWIIGLLVRISRGRWQFEGMKKSAEKMLRAFHDGIDALGVRRDRLVLPVCLGITAWLCDLLIAVLVFYALGVQVHFSAIVIVYSIGIAVQTIPLGIPGEIGVLDVLMATLYTLLGLPIAVSAVATLLIRIMTLWMRLLIGGITVQWLGIRSLRPSTIAVKTDLPKVNA